MAKSSIHIDCTTSLTILDGRHQNSDKDFTGNFVFCVRSVQSSSWAITDSRYWHFLEKNGCSGVWTINSFLIWWSLSLQKLFATNNSIKECFVLFQCRYNLLLFGLDSLQLMQRKNGKLFSCGSGGKAGHPPTGRSWLDPWFLQAVGESILGQDTEPWYSPDGSTA